MNNVMNWSYLPKDDAEEDETSASSGRGKANAGFTRFVHAISGKAKVRMLERDEELDLVQAWVQNGDQDALKRLISAFDPLILTMARNVATKHAVGHMADDVYQSGQEAFIKAIKKFEPAQGNRLSTYIRYTVAGEMMRFCLDNRMPMRTGTSRDERVAYYQYRAAIDAFKSEVGRAPGDAPSDLAAITARLGVSQTSFKRARQTHAAKVIPIQDVQLWDGAGDVETERDIDAVRSLLLKEFAGLADQMKPRDAKIVGKFYAMNGDQEAARILGKELEITPERVRQIAREGLRLIRASLERKGYQSPSDLMAVS
jgi:RNA polymerase sigma-32 factor